MKIKSLSLLSVIFFIFSIGCSARAQNNVSEADSANYKTFNLYFINGYALSYDMIKNDKSVIRVHLDFSGSLTDINSNLKHLDSNSPTQSTTTDQKNGSLSVSISFYYLHKFYNSNIGEFYAGIGPGFGYSKNNISSDQNTIQYNTNYVYSSNNDTEDYSLGLTFVLGLKSYITNTLSVFAESHFAGGKRWENQESSYTDAYGNFASAYTSGDGWFYDTQFIRAGISVSL